MHCLGASIVLQTFCFLFVSATTNFVCFRRNAKCSLVDYDCLRRNLQGRNFVWPSFPHKIFKNYMAFGSSPRPFYWLVHWYSTIYFIPGVNKVASCVFTRSQQTLYVRTFTFSSFVSPQLSPSATASSPGSCSDTEGVYAPIPFDVTDRSLKERVIRNGSKRLQHRSHHRQFEQAWNAAMGQW